MSPRKGSKASGRTTAKPKEGPIRGGSLFRLEVRDPSVEGLDLKNIDDFRKALSRLCGREVVIGCSEGPGKECGDCPGCTASGQMPRLAEQWTLGKLNQALLLARRPAMSEGFFRCFFPNEASDAELRAGITQFRAYAMLRFGGFRPAFDRLSGLDESQIAYELRGYCQDPASLRGEYDARSHGQDLIRPDEIRIDERWYLGYISDRQLMRDLMKEEALRWRVDGVRPPASLITARYRSDPASTERYETGVATYYRDIKTAEVTAWRGRLDAKRAELETMSERRSDVVKIAERNSAAYLAASHIDVYVATSMRESWEYEAMARVAEEIFADAVVAPLDLTMFDPTLSYYESRYDKGLVEGLMLNRARVTIYMVQETDTLGKDSELAATLAYGRPVIAYVPRYTSDALVNELRRSRLRRTFTRLLHLVAEDLISLDAAKPGLDLMRRYKPSFELDLAEEEVFRKANRKKLEDVYALVAQAEIVSLDRRARTINEVHPLGLQLQQGTGVAVGILLARTPKRCATLLAQLLTNQLRLHIHEDREAKATRLIECEDPTSEATFRVVTMDPVLTNAFWERWS